jgi:hypothetical protein
MIGTSFGKCDSDNPMAEEIGGMLPVHNEAPSRGTVFFACALCPPERAGKHCLETGEDLVAFPLFLRTMLLPHDFGILTQLNPS